MSKIDEKATLLQKFKGSSNNKYNSCNTIDYHPVPNTYFTKGQFLITTVVLLLVFSGIFLSIHYGLDALNE